MPTTPPPQVAFALGGVGTCPRARSPCDILGGDERQFPRRKAPTKPTAAVRDCANRGGRHRSPPRDLAEIGTASGGLRVQAVALRAGLAVDADRRLDVWAVLVFEVRRSRGRYAGGEAGHQRHRTKRAALGGKAAPSGAVARIFPAWVLPPALSGATASVVGAPDRGRGGRGPLAPSCTAPAGSRSSWWENEATLSRHLKHGSWPPGVSCDPSARSDQFLRFVRATDALDPFRPPDLARDMSASAPIFR